MFHIVWLHCKNTFFIEKKKLRLRTIPDCCNIEKPIRITHLMDCVGLLLSASTPDGGRKASSSLSSSTLIRSSSSVRSRSSSQTGSSSFFSTAAAASALRFTEALDPADIDTAPLDNASDDLLGRSCSGVPALELTEVDVWTGFRHLDKSQSFYNRSKE